MDQFDNEETKKSYIVYTDNSKDEKSNNDIKVETNGVPAKGKVGTADYNAVYYGG